MSLSIPPNSVALTVLETLSNSNQGTAAGSSLATGAGTADAAGAADSATANATVWALSQRASGTAASGAATSGLSRALSISDVGAAAALSISDLLSQLRDNAAAAANPDTPSASRGTLNANFRSLLEKVAQTVASASSGGVNLLDGSQTGDLQFSAGASGGSVTLSAGDLSLGGSILTLSADSSIDTPTAAAGSLTALDTSITNLTQALSTLQSQAKQISVHSGFVQAYSSVLAASGDSGAGMDADSARLLALQVQQQLSGQSLSIANQSPQAVLSLFR
ncbi:MAG TPA: flagellin [Caulobacteraceae bacterium]